MGYAYCLGLCIVCKSPFSFHPNKVPSIRVNNQREPVCLTCITEANPNRIRNGLEPIIPLPGAYEPADEHELGWP